MESRTNIQMVPMKLREPSFRCNESLTENQKDEDFFMIEFF